MEVTKDSILNKTEVLQTYFDNNINNFTVIKSFHKAFGAALELLQQDPLHARYVKEAKLFKLKIKQRREELKLERGRDRAANLI